MSFASDSSMPSTDSTNHLNNLLSLSPNDSIDLSNENIEMSTISNHCQHTSTTMKIDEQVSLSEESYVPSGESSHLTENNFEEKLNKSNHMSNGKVNHTDTFASNGNSDTTNGNHTPVSQSISNDQSNGINGECLEKDGHLTSPNTTNDDDDISTTILSQTEDETPKVSTPLQSNGHMNGHSQMSNGSIVAPQTLNSESPAFPAAGNSFSNPPFTPFPLLAGELFYAKEEIREGIVYLTNYRLYVKPSKPEETLQKNYQLQQQEQLINLPIGVIDAVELRDLNFLVVFTKYVQSFILSFQNAETASLWHKRLNDAPNVKVEDLFCFKFFSNLSAKSPVDYPSLIMFKHNQNERNPDPLKMVTDEFNRMGFDKKNWKICDFNKEFKFCHSYPQYFIVPNEITSNDLEVVGNFRFSRRIPVVVWRSKKNGCVIARSSQPIVGWLGWRSNQDEKLLQKICNISNRDTQKSYAKNSRKDLRPTSNGFSTTPKSDTCNGDILTTSLTTDSDGNNGCLTGNGHSVSNGSLANGLHHNSMERLDEDASSNKLLILDARSYTAALANRTLGGGCECPEYYLNCEIQFMSLPNIHTIRKSFDTLRYICETSRIDQQNWFSMLDSTKWFNNLASLIKVSCIVVDTISIQERPVLVHCSDGWDRTPQVVALAQLMLDPFYRTLDGFRVLIEREWLQFGHKFADRCRSSSLNIDPNERCPVFLQWLDCVHQLIKQFPCEFEFNVYYLIKLVYHTYSNLFGTFVFNNVQERIAQKVYEQTVSIWSYLDVEKSIFTNYLYDPKQEVLRPSYRIKDIAFWDDVYVPVSATTSFANIIPYKENFKQNENIMGSGIFVTRKSDMESSMLNEANIDESSIEFDCNHEKKCQSRSKCDLNRSASFENIASSKKNASMADNFNGLSKTCLEGGEEFDPECKIGRHLSDSFLFSSEQSIDRDKFLSSSTRTNDLTCDNKQQQFVGTNGEDSSGITETTDNSREETLGGKGHPHTRFLTRDSGNYTSELLNLDFITQSLDHIDLPSVPLLDNNPTELFDIDGQNNMNDKSYLQLQYLLIRHRRTILNLCEQLNEKRNKNQSLRSRSKTNPQLQNSNCSRKHSSYTNGDRHVDPLDSPHCDNGTFSAGHNSCNGIGRSSSSNDKNTSAELSPRIDRPRSMTEGRTYCTE